MNDSGGHVMILMMILIMNWERRNWAGFASSPPNPTNNDKNGSLKDADRTNMFMIPKHF
jgi:hypothetical protein